MGKNDVIAQGLRDLVEFQKEQAEHSATELIEKSFGLLAAGKCPKKIIEQQIDSDVDRLIEALTCSLDLQEIELIDLSGCDDDRLPQCLAIIREGSEEKRLLLQKTLSERSYGIMAQTVLDRVEGMSDIAIAKETILAYGGDDRLVAAMIKEVKRRAG